MQLREGGSASSELFGASIAFGRVSGQPELEASFLSFFPSANPGCAVPLYRLMLNGLGVADSIRST
jgi:hypothetical protein